MCVFSAELVPVLCLQRGQGQTAEYCFWLLCYQAILGIIQSGPFSDYFQAWFPPLQSSSNMTGRPKLEETRFLRVSRRSRRSRRRRSSTRSDTATVWALRGPSSTMHTDPFNSNSEGETRWVFLVCRGDNFPRSYQEEQNPERFSQAWEVDFSHSPKRFIPLHVPTGPFRYTPPIGPFRYKRAQKLSIPVSQNGVCVYGNDIETVSVAGGVTCPIAAVGPQTGYWLAEAAILQTLALYQGKKQEKRPLP